MQKINNTKQVYLIFVIILPQKFNLSLFTHLSKNDDKFRLYFYHPDTTANKTSLAICSKITSIASFLLAKALFNS